jgi:uncharacterized delta-60 repeat protein
VVDGTFNVDTAGWDLSSLQLRVQTDGKIVLAGQSNGVVVVRRLLPDGSHDASFRLDPRFASFTSNWVGAIVQALAIQPDGKLLVAESWIVVDQAPATRLIRLDSDGTLDQRFDTRITGGGSSTAISALELLPDARIFIAGRFSAVNGMPQQNATLLKSDGTIDPRLDPARFQNPKGVAMLASVALTHDGRLLVGGRFDPTANLQANLARLNIDGTAVSA